MSIGLTEHAVAIEHARAAVAAVDQAFERMAQSGELRELNAMFKQARRVDPSLHYRDFVAARKAGMLEEVARRANG